MKTLIGIILITLSLQTIQAQNYWGATNQSSNQVTVQDLNTYVDMVSFLYGDMMGYPISNEYRNQVYNTIANQIPYMNNQQIGEIKSAGITLNSLQTYWYGLSSYDQSIYRQQAIASNQPQQYTGTNYNDQSKTNSGSSGMDWGTYNQMYNMNQSYYDNMNSLNGDYHYESY